MLPSSCSVCPLSSSLVLGSYLSRIGRIENPSCSDCRHLSQDSFHLILRCPAMDSLRRSLFGDSLSLYDLCQDRGELPSFWGSMVFRHVPIPLKRSCNSNNNMMYSVLRTLTNNEYMKSNAKPFKQKVKIWKFRITSEYLC